MTAAVRRLWTPADAAALDGLHLWLTPEGYPLCERRPDGTLLVLASTTDLCDASDVPAGTRHLRAGAAGLAEAVPAGYGLLVDGATPGRRTVPASVLDAVRSGTPPAPGTPGLRTGALRPGVAPADLSACADAAVRVARSAGALQARALWAVGGGDAGLWIAVRPATDCVLDAAYDAVACVSPSRPVLLVDEQAVPGPVTGLPLGLVLATLLGSGLVVAGREVGSSALLALGAAVLAAVLPLAVLVRAVPTRRGPSPAAGTLVGLLVCAGLVWQAARALV